MTTATTTEQLEARVAQLEEQVFDLAQWVAALGYTIGGLEWRPTIGEVELRWDTVDDDPPNPASSYWVAEPVAARSDA